MNFTMNVEQNDSPWTGNIEVQCPGKTDEQTESFQNTEYDLGRRVSFVCNGRTYDVRIGRVRLHGSVGR